MSQQAILTINAGSSSIKFSVFLVPELLQVLVGQIDGVGGEATFKACWVAEGREEGVPLSAGSVFDHSSAFLMLIEWLHRTLSDVEIVAVGHRVVHGGQKYSEPTLIDEDIMLELEQFMVLAPLHQSHNLSGIRSAQAHFKSIPQVACFDTAFHRTHGFVDDCYAIPRSFYEKGVCRYGFHGLSYEYITSQLLKHFPEKAHGKVLIAHLGNGASMAALRDGVSIASTMGFSSLDGLPMGTRCGEIDPGVLLYLMQHELMDADAISEVLYKQSGLKGLSGGLSSDMRVLEGSYTIEAKQAIEYYVREIKREIGALTALLAGLDLIVFTGGIGENSSLIRERTLSDMAWLGIILDGQSNAEGNQIISSKDSKVLCIKMHTDEEYVIAKRTLKLMQSPSTASP